ncbi:hypothetical protein E4U43_003534 [Claviceps pusilla]|uniref:Chromo domain-containing protein n=1 Tax=Claviceps pusilla TaxID=123648 RepID=A0A9P7N733_9HYPO|nr:hypothetical protein E4U43_003534 [Claviceps pusilla]
MTSILTSIFSSRKSAMDRDVASSPLGPKSTLPTRQLKRKSLPEKKARQSVKSSDHYDDVPPSPPFKSTKTRSTAKAPAKSSAQLPAKAVKPPGQLPAKVSLDQGDAVHEPAEPYVADGRIAPTKAHTDEPVTNANEVDEAGAEAEYAFDKFTDYRWVGNSIDIQVKWQDGDVTWEQEAVLHEDARDALLAYWKSQGGRPTNPHDPDLFDIHAIRKHSRDRKKLLVEWVGYDPKEASWVPCAAVEETAPEVVADYWRSIRNVRPAKRRA